MRSGLTPQELAAATLRTPLAARAACWDTGSQEPRSLQGPRSPRRDASFPLGSPLHVPAVLPHKAAGLLVAAPGPCVGVRGSVRAPPSPPREEIPLCAPQGCSFMSASGSVSTSLQPGGVGGSCKQGPPLSPCPLCRCTRTVLGLGSVAGGRSRLFFQDLH